MSSLISSFFSPQSFHSSQHLLHSTQQFILLFSVFLFFVFSFGFVYFLSYTSIFFSLFLLRHYFLYFLSLYSVSFVILSSGKSVVKEKEKNIAFHFYRKNIFLFDKISFRYFGRFLVKCRLNKSERDCDWRSIIILTWKRRERLNKWNAESRQEVSRQVSVVKQKKPRGKEELRRNGIASKRKRINMGKRYTTKKKKKDE